MGATAIRWTKVWPLRPLSSLHSPSRGGEEERPFGNQRCQVCNSVNLAKCVFMKTQRVFVKTQCVFKSVFIFPINLRTARKYFGKALLFTYYFPNTKIPLSSKRIVNYNNLPTRRMRARRRPDRVLEIEVIRIFAKKGTKKSLEKKASERERLLNGNYALCILFALIMHNA